MERVVAFTDYDIFAYLIVGLTLLAAADLILRTQFIFRQEWGFGIITITVIVAYVIGQIVSLPSEWLLEEGLVKEALGSPVKSLMLSDSDFKSLCEPPSSPPKVTWLARTVLFYTQPLDCHLQKKIRDKAAGLQGDALFFEAFSAAKQEPSATDRMLVFSRLYIFCRNMAFAVLLTAGALLARTWLIPAEPMALPIHRGPLWLTLPRWQIAILFGAAIALVYRYLFFYRIFSIEVLTTYAFAVGTAATK